MRFLICIIVFIITGCQEEVRIPEPVQLTRDAEGFYCNMIVIDHPGPKAQVYEKGREKAIWFTSVRDALVYNILPGEAQDVQVIYVHDMGQAESWEKPQTDGIWIKAKDAFYVLESNRRGGMGAKETVPFRDAVTADKFSREYGGRVVSYADISLDYILGDAGEYDATGD